MTRIKLALWGFVLGLTALWLMSDARLIFGPHEFFAVRNALVNYTGIIAIAAMSVALLLAVRPVVLETAFDGLDKMYRLHKWLGIAALGFAVAHWFIAKGPKWAVGLGLMERRPRGPRPEITDPVQQVFAAQRGLAEGLGEWAFYGAAILILLALIKWFPYRLFHKTHIWLSAVYLVLVYHSVILFKFENWATLIGPIVALLLAGGSLAAIVLLARSFMPRPSRSVPGHVESAQYLEDNHVLRVEVKLDGRWSGHEAGQFAFVTFDRKEGAHPFTIASAWTGDGHLSFLIKELGDYTRALPASLKAGDAVQIEGPFGRFDFGSDKPRQIWVAGGIGISPFIARMQALETTRDGKPVDLFFSTAAPNVAQFLPALSARAQRAGVDLHVRNAPPEPFITAADITSAIPQWREADVWFCGPSAFGAAMHRDLTAAGLPSASFHQEFFEMR